MGLFHKTPSDPLYRPPSYTLDVCACVWEILYRIEIQFGRRRRKCSLEHKGSPVSNKIANLFFFCYWNESLTSPWRSETPHRPVRCCLPIPPFKLYNPLTNPITTLPIFNMIHIFYTFLPVVANKNYISFQSTYHPRPIVSVQKPLTLVLMPLPYIVRKIHFNIIRCTSFYWYPQQQRMPYGTPGTIYMCIKC